MQRLQSQKRFWSLPAAKTLAIQWKKSLNNQHRKIEKDVSIAIRKQGCQGYNANVDSFTATGIDSLKTTRAYITMLGMGRKSFKNKFSRYTMAKQPRFDSLSNFSLPIRLLSFLTHYFFPNSINLIVCPKSYPEKNTLMTKFWPFEENNGVRLKVQGLI